MARWRGVALALLLTACSPDASPDVPDVCGFDAEAVIEWSGPASLQDLEIPLQGPPGVEQTDKGQAFVTGLGRDGDRNYCIVYDRAGNGEWFVSGALPSTWDLPAPS